LDVRKNSIGNGGKKQKKKKKKKKKGVYKERLM
jgi:hypothetical protein